MATVFLYILDASPDPDRVQCVVPYRVNEELIFFGPCKKRLRQNLKKQYLKDAEETFPKEDLFLVGVNAANAARVRKIIWAGKIRQMMTFEHAYNCLTGSEFNHLRTHEYSPLHVRPIYSGGEFAGYEHCSREHEGHWYADLLRGETHPHAYTPGEQLLLRPEANRNQVLVRDCCFLCENVFFAKGQRLLITDDMLAVLKKAQPDKKVDRYAIFGYTANGLVDGKRGNSLMLTDTLADEFLSTLKLNNISPLSLGRYEDNAVSQGITRKRKSC